MPLVVDNLRLDHRVTVLQDFTDTAGTAMRAGQSGILRGLSYDQLRGIIQIEIELETGRVTVVSPITAEIGPRNGHMKEYFELGDYVPVPGTETAVHDPSARKMMGRKPIGSNVDATAADYDGPDRLEDVEREMLNGYRHIGIAVSIAEMYAARMSMFQLAGHEPRAVAAFKLAIEWMNIYAGWATSGGEAAALCRERDQFHASLVRQFGYDPTEPAAEAAAAAVAPKQDDSSGWVHTEPGLDRPDRLEEWEREMRRRIDHIGVAASIAEMYAGRMRLFRRAGNEPRAAAAFKLAVEWMATYAGWATSGGEGAALSYERDQFRAALVREFGYDPTQEKP